MKQYLDFYNFGLWVFDVLDFTKPKMKMSDVIEIVEHISPDSYEQLAEIIIKNTFYNEEDYDKHRKVFDEIVKYLIISFNENDVKIFHEKSALIEFMVERRN
jgi:hypothetical protein